MNIKSCLIIQQLLKKEVYMATEKINITDTLRLNIVERRKALGISSYDLSEKSVMVILNFGYKTLRMGKPKNIKDDLIKIYMILEKQMILMMLLILLSNFLNNLLERSNVIGMN